MIDGRTVVDAHVHAPRLSTLKPSWLEWAEQFSGPHDWRSAYDDDGVPIPSELDALMAAEGVDRVLLFSEYSPRVTGWQLIEDLLPFREYDPDLFAMVANVNPHVHHPLTTELRRQLDLGAIALKLHPVHAGFPMDMPELYPVYALCESSGIPIFVHAGTSNFPGARNRYASLDHLVDVVRDFPGCTFLLSHGGRGWSYDTAAMLALTYDNVWIDIAGLPPRKLPVYYARQDLARLARRFVFGSDWPGLPSISGNIAAIRDLGLPEETTAAVLYGNASAIFGFGDS